MRFRTGTVAALFVLFLASFGQAQTVTAKASWNSSNSLVDANAFKYSLLDGAATPIPITNVTCALVASVVNCSGTIPIPTAGPHSFVILASSPDGSLQAASLALVGSMPGQPGGVKVTVIISIP